MTRLAALIRRLARHGRDGQIQDLIDTSWAAAALGDWAGCERAIHAVQAAHPDALYGLVWAVADLVIDQLREPDGTTPLVRLTTDSTSGSLPAWLILCRALDTGYLAHADLAARSDEQRRDEAVALLRYAVALTAEAAR